MTQATNKYKWISTLPKDYKIVKLKYLSSISTGMYDTQDKLEEGRYPFFVRSPHIERIDTYSHDCEAVMTAGDGVGVGKVFHYYNGKFAAHQRVYVFNQFHDDVLGRYIYYSLMSNLKFEVLQGNAKSTVDSLRYSMLSEFPIILPNINLQTIITKFLDQKTSEIDNLIEDKEKLIALLEEKRQAVITEAVTKGLNPNVKMKDSGVEWIGEIPEHWSMSKVGYLFDVQLGKMLQPTRKLESDKYVPYLKAINVQDDGLTFDSSIRMYATPKDLSTYDIKKGDLLICEGGDIGRSTLVEQKYKGVIFQNSLHRIRSVLNNVRFMHYAMQAIRYSGYINVLVNRLTIAHLTREKLVNIRIAIPKKEEQDSIVNFLDSTTDEIMTLTSYEREIILKLKEYRQALIYEAVTGKIDVQEMIKETEQKEVTTS